MQSVIEAIKQLSKYKKIAIITHINADADGLCSLIAFKRLIKKLVKKHLINKKNQKIENNYI